MTRARLILAGCALLAAAAHCSAAPAQQQVTVTLSPADDAADDAPYRRAILMIHNHSPAAIASATIRWQLGGPTFVHPITVAPGSAASLPVVLPAVAIRQTYLIELTTGDARTDEPLRATADIYWPERLVNPAAFIDPAAYEPYQSDRPLWPASIRRRVMLIGLALLVVMTGALLIRRPTVRLAAIMGVVAISLIAALVFMHAQQIVLPRISDDGQFLILTARRTATWTSARTDLTPIYIDRAQMVEDTLIVSPDSISLTLRPGRIQLLRRPLEAPRPKP
ncbi:hypothetical protein LCGC14_0335440 [marine sediment metagenome]|uniref:Uncharacterized protein n=1 Tax=marine sediment metagenome TaxID=412755 RepID=A0A0F9TFC0_9ZZZZ|nr:hypothetical protein [Phycisphaerae bacterium]HDZ43750.1 hypothetical protein [Phycisphaerae bacterium]